MSQGYAIWWIKFPLDVYAMKLSASLPCNAREVRAWVRRSYGYKRLPRGFQCWRAY